MKMKRKAAVETGHLGDLSLIFILKPLTRYSTVTRCGSMYQKREETRLMMSLDERSKTRVLQGFK
jgi:hypothetical protein